MTDETAPRVMRPRAILHNQHPKSEMRETDLIELAWIPLGAGYGAVAPSRARTVAETLASES